jgi:hypothetical protein
MRLLRLSLLINYFSITKNVKKAVTAINIGRTWMEVETIYESFDVNLNLFNLSLIFFYFATVLGVRYFFVRSKQW